jgi:hypothetical protein
LAELPERGLHNLRFGLASPRRENYAQRVAGTNRSAMFIPSAWLFASAVHYQDRKRKEAARKSKIPCNTLSKIPFVKGKQSSFKPRKEEQ